MENPKSDLSIPPEWRERFILKRIKQDDLHINLETRNEIIKAMSEGARFVQVQKYTIMVNSISSIDPYWGSLNIPPRPKIGQEYEGVGKDQIVRYSDNKEDIKKRDLWDKIFGQKVFEQKQLT